MSPFLTELLEHWRSGAMTLPQIARQLRALSNDRDSQLDALRQAAAGGMLDDTAAQQLIHMLETGEISVPHMDAQADPGAPTLLRTISAQPPLSVTLVPMPSGAAPLGTQAESGGSHPKTEVNHQRLAAAFGTMNSDTQTGETATAAPGAIIKSRFILKEQIGRGGMGAVFAAIDRRKTEARDPNPLVAIKVLDAELARYQKAWIALQREAGKAQSLAHPNIVTVYDFDRDGDTAFMTMELLDGESLENAVRQARKARPLPRTVWPIVRGIAAGLAYAHRNGIVHSDLKPGNVFVTRDGQVKVLDFGIARAMPTTLAQQLPDLFDAASLGAYTAAYATAEMMQAAAPHPSDDLYALGLITYELLTGQHPFKRKNAVEAAQAGLTPAPIKGLTTRQWRLLKRCLSFNREDRPHDAGQFLRELDGLTPLQQGTLAVVVILVLTAGFFSYRSWQAAGPDIALTALPVATQQQFARHMQAGDELWSFFEQDRNLLALQEAVEQYARAYSLHPRNRDATRALQRAAETGLAALKADSAKQRELAKALAQRSEYLANHEPVQNLLNAP